MGWKDLSYVTRGSLIGFLFVMIIALGGLNYQPLNLPLFVGQIIFIFIDELIIGGTMKNPSFSEPIRIGIYFFISAIIYALLGALIGWIVGKIKNINN